MVVPGVDGFVDADDFADEGGKGQDIAGVVVEASLVVENIVTESNNFFVLVQDDVEGEW